MDWSKVTQSIPPHFWTKTGVFLLLIVLIVVAMKTFKQSNKIWLMIVFAVTFGVFFFSWIYNRNEPKFLTPVIEPLSQFFPTKGYTRPEPGNFDKTKKKK